MPTASLLSAKLSFAPEQILPLRPILPKQSNSEGTKKGRIHAIRVIRSQRHATWFVLWPLLRC